MYSRVLILAIFLVIHAPFEAYAGTATQTDWSGGDGIWGPVFDWGDESYMNTDIECYGDPSNVTLHKILEHAVSSDFDYAVSVYSADINGDGYMDILGASAYDDDITWWENDDSTGTYWKERTIEGDFNGAISVNSADVDGDGDMDVLGAAWEDDDIIWWENVDGAGTSWTEHTVDGDFSSAQCVYSSDINGDGYMDVLGAASYAHDITWWENVDGSGTSWTEHTIDGDFDGAYSVYSADINGDGDMDVLGAARYDGDITWWENVDGTGTSWIEYTLIGDFYGAISVHSADVDGDGDMDVLGAALEVDDIIWWENVNGAGTSWNEHTVDGYFNGPVSVYSADLNGDGYMDVLGAAADADDIAWWENVDGTGTNWTEHTVDGDFDGAHSVYPTDLNGDGNMDVLGAARYDDDITWWDLTGDYLSNGSLESSVLDVQESPDWQTIGWTCTEPSGTDVAFQVRASDDSFNMGTWSVALPSPCNLAGILTEGNRYFQYRAILTTADSLLTPVLHDVTVEWLPYTGIQGGSAGEVAALYGARPNPTLGNATLVFSLPVDSWAELTVYDLTGRIVHSVSGEYEMGVHEVILNDLASGMYVVRMTSKEFTEAQRFVVIN